MRIKQQWFNIVIYSVCIQIVLIIHNWLLCMRYNKQYNVSRETWSWCFLIVLKLHIVESIVKFIMEYRSTNNIVIKYIMVCVLELL